MRARPAPRAPRAGGIGATIRIAPPRPADRAIAETGIAVGLKHRPHALVIVGEIRIPARTPIIGIATLNQRVKTWERIGAPPAGEAAADTVLRTNARNVTVKTSGIAMTRPRAWAREEITACTVQEGMATANSARANRAIIVHFGHATRNPNAHPREEIGAQAEGGVPLAITVLPPLARCAIQPIIGIVTRKALARVRENIGVRPRIRRIVRAPNLRAAELPHTVETGSAMGERPRPSARAIVRVRARAVPRTREHAPAKPRVKAPLPPTFGAWMGGFPAAPTPIPVPALPTPNGIAMTKPVVD